VPKKACELLSDKTMSLREYALAFGSGNSAAILLKRTSEDIDDLTLASAVFCPSPFGQMPS
jgi:hypothetical protein